MGILADVEAFRKELSNRRSIGLNSLDFAEQLTYLVFLKLAHERTELGYEAIVPAEYGWSELARNTGADLERRYRETLEFLSTQPGLVGLIYRKAQNQISAPAVLARLVKELVGPEGRNWTGLHAAEKGEMFEHVLRKAAPVIGSKASQFYTSRPLFEALVEVVQPEPDESFCDPACGTAGSLIATYQYLARKSDLDRDQKLALQTGALTGIESLETAARLGMMNLILHGIARLETEGEALIAASDPLAAAPKRHFDVVITNPPFGSESAGSSSRADFWAEGNNQLNYLQHVRLMLEIPGRAAVFVPDDVLFLGGDGEKVRRRLLTECRVHTLLRLPTGISFAQGVKSNVLFFDRVPLSGKAATSELWVYDFRTGNRFTPVQSPLKRADLDDFVSAFCPGRMHEREESDRFRRWTLDELKARPEFNLDIWANIPQGPVIDTRPAEEIVPEMLGLLASAHSRIAALGRELGITLAESPSSEASSSAPREP